ncbi:hypothetical protein [Janthinobacterium sp.]|jgi:hypothetical protein|uniref:hypothetical protein n=1 Tax=Janthinobacterium sp. TaxID=1871054 RepID=UPI0028A0306D|nr:hypothetical protein [Janthinobacterium sp.]
MDDNGKHIRELEKKVSALSDALAHLGKGTTLEEFLRLLRNPGYTTPAELTFNHAILDTMQLQVNALDKLGQDLVAGAKQVGSKQ